MMVSKYARRSVLKGVGAAAVTLTAARTGFTQDRTGQAIKVEAKGRNFVRYKFGDLTLIALRDGYVDMPPTRLRQGGGQAYDHPPSAVPLVDGMLRLSVNAYLIIEQDLHFLIDTGASNSWEPSMGRLLDALAAADVSRDKITNIALTHTHTDHVNGLVAPDGSGAFPKAERIFVGLEEAPIFDTSNRLARFRERLVPIDNNFPISDRITAVRAAGHSIAHTAFEVEAGEERLLVWGDIIHVPSAQFSRPELTWELDGDQGNAMETRLRILDRVSKPNFYVAGAHLDFPGVGRVQKRGNSFHFGPLE
ncbi:MBL fold metallo-hydrolase [Phyllobacterium sp. CCNWLW109]|uniref:MBL fold metallo-hydrolase n=1 Tax=Phyllobacterium sp. CCNWLW109 TaxID=3127479 RepID=UPI003076BCD6